MPPAPADLFQDHAAALHELYRQMPSDVRGNTETKRRLWLDMLQVSGIAPHDNDADQLFVTHSLLISIARIVTHTLTPQEKNWKGALRDGFVSWIIDSHTGIEWANSLRLTIDQHDWKRRQQGVMQSLYMHFVSAADRKVFGEYYTPDWLAALIVREALDDAWLTNAVEQAESAGRTSTRLEGLGVLDPTCGSGTFLYHAARRILDAPEIKELSPVQRADVTASLVHGIDVQSSCRRDREDEPDASAAHRPHDGRRSHPDPNGRRADNRRRPNEAVRNRRRNANRYAEETRDTAPNEFRTPAQLRG